MYIFTVLTGFLSLLVGHAASQGLMGKCFSYKLQNQLENLSKSFQTTHNLISDVNIHLSLDDCSTVRSDAVIALSSLLSKCQQLPSKNSHKVRIERLIKKKEVLNIFKDKIKEIINNKSGGKTNLPTLQTLNLAFIHRMENEAQSLERIYNNYSKACFFQKSIDTSTFRQSLNVAITKWNNFSAVGKLRRLLFNLMFVYENFVAEIHQDYKRSNKQNQKHRQVLY